MKMKLTYPLTFAGGAFGWQTVKAILIPAIALTSGVAGSAEYVRWVIKSQNAHTLPLNAAAEGAFTEEIQDNHFVDDLAEIVDARDDFIRTYKPDDHSDVYMSTRIESMRLEDVKILDKADQLRRRSAQAYTAEISSKTDRLRSLDEKLRILSDQASGRNGLPKP